MYICVHIYVYIYAVYIHICIHMSIMAYKEQLVQRNLRKCRGICVQVSETRTKEPNTRTHYGT